MVLHDVIYSCNGSVATESDDWERRADETTSSLSQCAGMQQLVPRWPLLCWWLRSNRGLERLYCCLRFRVCWFEQSVSDRTGRALTINGGEK